jgi:hypothetical protein
MPGVVVVDGDAPIAIGMIRMPVSADRIMNDRSLGQTASTCFAP